MDKIEKIKKIIETLLNDWKYGGSTEAKYRYEAYKELLEDIDSIQKEPVSKDLQEACDLYYDETWDEHGGKAMVIDGCHDIWFPSHATDDFFKAGAKWQEKQMQSAIELAEDHAMLAGMKKMREKMMKDAVGGTIVFAHFGDDNKECGFVSHDYFCLESMGLKNGDKVKVIILKDE